MKQYVLVVLAFLGIYIFNFVVKFELMQESPKSSPDFDCEAIRGPIGAEDLVQLDATTILTSHLDHIVAEKIPSEADPGVADPWIMAQKGQIWVLKLDLQQKHNHAIKPAKLTGRPAGVDFRPHGIGMLAESNILAVVNHAYARGGERVERYRIIQTANDVELVYLNHVDFTAKLNGAMNDVIPVSETEMYVTQWVWQPHPPAGKGIGFLHDMVYSGLAAMVISMRLTHLYYCNSNATEISAELACKIVGPKGVMWNGITADPVKKHVYALDLFDKRLYQFSRQEDGELVTNKRIDMGRYGDNIEFNHATGKVESGGMYLIGQCFMTWAEELGTDARTEKRVPTGGPSRSGVHCPSAQSVVDPVTREVTTPLIHDGSLLGGFSAAITISTNPTVVVAGSWGDDGLLVCTRKD